MGERTTPATAPNQRCRGGAGERGGASPVMENEVVGWPGCPFMRRAAVRTVKVCNARRFGALEDGGKGTRKTFAAGAGLGQNRSLLACRPEIVREGWRRRQARPYSSVSQQSAAGSGHWIGRSVVVYRACTWWYYRPICLWCSWKVGVRVGESDVVNVQGTRRISCL